MFEKEDENGDKVTVSIMEHFKSTYNIDLNPDLPSALVGAKSDPMRVRVPLELLKFVSCQPAPVDSEIQQKHIKATAASPHQRFESIEKIVDDLVADQETGADQTSKSFGLEMASSLITADAVVLKSPKLVYKDSRGNYTEPQTFKQSDGAWDLRARGGGDLAFVEGSAAACSLS